MFPRVFKGGDDKEYSKAIEEIGANRYTKAGRTREGRKESRENRSCDCPQAENGGTF